MDFNLFFNRLFKLLSFIWLQNAFIWNTAASPSSSSSTTTSQQQQSTVHHTETIIPQELSCENIRIKLLKFSILLSCMNDENKNNKDYKNNSDSSDSSNSNYNYKNKYNNNVDNNKTNTRYFELQTASRTFYMKLNEFNSDNNNNNFLAPNFHIEEKFGDLYTNSSLFTERHCFYYGKVYNEEESQITLNLCGGMQGILSTLSGDYFIEPLNRNDEGLEREHLLYIPTEKSKILKSKDRKEGETEKEHSRCGNSGLQQSKKIFHDYNFEFTSETLDIVPTRKRTRRAVSVQRYIETMIVADESMFNYFGKKEIELRRYLLSIMAIVTNIMKHHSVGNFIDISVVKLVILKKNPPSMDVSGKASHILKRFCRWQRRENRLDDNDPEHHDAAVLITRKDLCSSNDKCDTLGLAELGSVCDTQRSCAIVEDNGLSVAFTIAHELGHLINAPHDGEDNNCGGPHKPLHIMTPTFNMNLNSWSWSTCSRKWITEFLESKEASCLLDKPSPKFEHPLPLKLPGEMFTRNEQCQLIYGEESYACPFNIKCNRIWCVRKFKGTKSCHTNNMPWADGTKCDTGSWCLHGTCRKKEKVRAIDGQWGEWGPYNKCSRPCGGGIKIATRKCNNPRPEHGGNYCTGHRHKYKSCNIQTCKRSLVTFRAEQCQAFNGKDLGIPGVPANTKWLPKYNGVASEEQCKLFCQIQGYNGLWYELASKVIDGTKCRKGTNDICVDGQCRPAGCDHVLNSKARYDNCGVCNGDNSTCRTYVGYKNATHLGYNFVVHIPRGAFQVHVIQQSAIPGKHDTNFLALVDARRQYVFNGQWRVSLGKKRYTTYGTAVHYTGPNEMTEEIQVPAVLKTALEIRVLSIASSENVNIRYSYKFPVRGAQKYKWALKSQWSECYPVCQGYQIREYVCQREIDSQLVASSKCKTKKPQEKYRVCNLFCKLKWEVYRDECVAQNSCGAGAQNQKIVCKMSYLQKAKEDKILTHKDCHKAKIGKMPPREVPCFAPCTRVRWVYTPWSKCNQSCDGGMQSRQAVCVDQENNSTMESKKCQHTVQGPLVRPCHTFPCPKWHTGAWAGVCSVTCGRGMVERLVTCVIAGKTVSNDRCDKTTKPDETRPCVMSACATWKTRAWSKCSEPCGNGHKSREIFCETNAGERVSDSECNKSDKPVGRKTCFEKACEVKAKLTYNDHVDTDSLKDFRWLTGVWNECSASCGGGYRSRVVECVANNIIAKEENCVASLKPTTKEYCNTFSCPFWRHGAWSKCTKKCGKGSQTRLVLCGFNGTIVSDEWCTILSKPQERRFCNLHDCKLLSHVPLKEQPQKQSNWKTGEWSQCSTTCGSGYQKRRVSCPSQDCRPDMKPRNIISCDSGTCPGWNYGQWTPCYTDKGCGHGWQARLVVCQLDNGNLVQNNACDVKYKPTANKSCELEPCKQDAKWATTPWQPCNVPCGEGKQFRYISCEDPDGNELPESRCLVYKVKPTQEKSCTREFCPTWHVGDWEHCDSTCHHRRVVECRRGDDIVNDNLCKLDEKPVEEKECSNENCVREQKYTWTYREWSACGKTCGYSLKTREVLCINEESRIVEERFCADLPNKPRSVEQCFEGLCPPEWKVESWSECSVTCGHGKKTRNIYCTDSNGKTISNTLCNQETRLETTQDCSLGDCDDEYHWYKGEWEQCTKTCGIGQARREVFCYNSRNETKHYKKCNTETRPPNMKVCNTQLCPHNSCRDIQVQLGVKFDGEQTIQIGNQSLLVYCEGMHRTNPKEYITLQTDPKENYAEIYGKRLSDAKECPNNGRRQIPCNDCVDYTASGVTFFKKVRFDIKRLAIVPEDKTFADRFGRNPPGFASAGDCYSAAKCPQGRFMVNLQGTNLRIADNVVWNSRGYYTSQRIRRHKNNQVIYGKCGGYCGMCSPGNEIGLRVDIISKTPTR